MGDHDAQRGESSTDSSDVGFDFQARRLEHAVMHDNIQAHILRQINDYDDDEDDDNDDDVGDYVRAGHYEPLLGNGHVFHEEEFNDELPPEHDVDDEEFDADVSDSSDEDIDVDGGLNDDGVGNNNVDDADAEAIRQALLDGGEGAADLAQNEMVQIENLLGLVGNLLINP